MKTEDDAPIAREPWQRLLRERYDAPPEVTDARIRAAARRALAPRPSRWWLPASLAASVLLAVMLAQWQFGDDRRPATITESDVAAPLGAAPEAEDAAAGAAVADESAVDADKIDSRTQEAPAVEAAVAPSSVQPPLLDLPAVGTPPELTREREMPTTAITASEPVQEALPAAPARVEESLNLGELHGFAQSAAVPRDPEEWYAEIETLRAAGQIEEADAELARLEAAWPGWIEKNHPQNR